MVHKRDKKKCKVMKFGMISSIFLGVPLFLLVKSFTTKKHFWPQIILQFCGAVFAGCTGGPSSIFMIDTIHDVSVRYSVIGIAYNVSQAIFGGTAPLALPNNIK